jgi:hypothetical protein
MSEPLTEERTIDPERSKCGKQATLVCFWPGEKPRLCCKDCGKKALALAEAMGFYLYALPYFGPDSCEQEKRSQDI